MYTRMTVGLEEATRATQAIIDCVKRENERPVSVAVVDDRGELVMFTRMDEAAPSTVNLSINKAYTSARRRRDTSTISKIDAENGFDNSDWGDSRFTKLGGGICVKADEPLKAGIPALRVAGAIGVSGLPSGEADEKLAFIGLQAIQGK